MIDYIDADYVASSIRLLRTQFKGAILIVEGDSDELFYERFVNSSHCRIIISFGRDNAILVLQQLQKSPGIMAIIDSDFDALTGGGFSMPNLMATDTHDLETMLLSSPALDKLLKEFGQKKKIEGFEIKYGLKIRDKLIHSGKTIGYFLWYSNTKKLCLKFDDLNFGKFVDDKTLSIDPEKMIQTVANHSQNHSIVASLNASSLLTLQDDTHDLWHVCCGHHLIELLSIGLRKALGSHNTGDVKPEYLEKILRSSYEEVYFLETRLYALIREWEEKNLPYTVLKQARV